MIREVIGLEGQMWMIRGTNRDDKGVNMDN